MLYSARLQKVYEKFPFNNIPTFFVSLRLFVDQQVPKLKPFVNFESTKSKSENYFAKMWDYSVTESKKQNKIYNKIEVNDAK